MQLKQKPELLAPAGTLEGVRAVLDAGADAVYAGGKQLNMRQHRQSYNLSEEQLAEAIRYAHDNGKKLYLTLNSLIRDSQLPQLRDVLKTAGALAPDALIVQDLAAAALAREICVHVPLHASTMMNVHNAETALALKMMGFTRIIASRDIPLHEIGTVAEKSGMEVECFVHGDMCITHSSLCYASGILFGESANCGRCMKPCRWKWKLTGQKENAEFEGPTEGHLLARKDLCLFQHIPALVHSGIVSFKIEGRMRTAEFVVEVVETYRRAIDEYVADPVHYATNAARMETLWNRRVREFTTALTFTNTGAEGVDTSGTREPRFFSYSADEAFLSIDQPEEAAVVVSPPELIVHVVQPATAQAALDHGADAIYLNDQGYANYARRFEDAWLKDFTAQAAEKGTRVALMMPAVTDHRDMAEWKARLAGFRGFKGLAVGVSNLGSLAMVKTLGFRDIVADFTMNVSNSVAADELSTLGVTRITASVELSLDALANFARQCRLPLEVIGQGPLPAMLMEHCVIASAAGASPEGICPMHCRKDRYVLQDERGHQFPLVCDRRCRNHLLTPTDTCVLPRLRFLAAADVAGIRIETQLYDPPQTEQIVMVYRNALEALKSGRPVDVAADVETMEAATGRMMSDGALRV